MMHAISGVATAPLTVRCLLITLLFLVTGKSDGIAFAAPIDRTAAKSRSTTEVFSLSMTPRPGSRAVSTRSPAAAERMLKSAVSRSKRNAGKDEGFSATVVVNGSKHTFSRPESALKAVQTVRKVMLQAAKAKIPFSKLGGVPVANGKTNGKETGGVIGGTAGSGGKPDMAAIQRGMQVLQQRIKLAIDREVRRTAPGPPNLKRIRAIIQAEQDRAKRDGTVPKNIMFGSGVGGGVGGGFGGGVGGGFGGGAGGGVIGGGAAGAASGTSVQQLQQLLRNGFRP